MTLRESRIKKLLVSAVVAASLLLGLAGGLTADDASARACAFNDIQNTLPCLGSEPDFTYWP